MWDIAVCMRLPIKSHADWQHCIFLIRKKSLDSVVEALLTELPLLIMFWMHHARRLANQS